MERPRKFGIRLDKQTEVAAIYQQLTEPRVIANNQHLQSHEKSSAVGQLIRTGTNGIRLERSLIITIFSREITVKLPSKTIPEKTLRRKYRID